MSGVELENCLVDSGSHVQSYSLRCVKWTQSVSADRAPILNLIII